MEGAFQKNRGGESMVQLRIVWQTDSGTRRQTLPLVSSATNEQIQNVLQMMGNLTTRLLSAAYRITYETIV